MHIRERSGRPDPLCTACCTFPVSHWDRTFLGGCFMAMTDNHKIQRPVAPLKIAYLSGSHEMAKAVDNSLVKTRRAISGRIKETSSLSGYIEPTYLIDTHYTRFGTGEGKVRINAIIFRISNVSFPQRTARRTGSMLYSRSSTKAGSTDVPAESLWTVHLR